MMSIRDKFRRVHFALTLLQGFLVFVSAAISAVAKLDSATMTSPLWKQLTIYLQNTAWWTPPLCILLVPIVQYSKNYFGQPKLWDCIHFMLNDFRGEAFSEEQASQAFHRVTLFQHKTCCFSIQAWRLYKTGPLAGWLVPVERSGHLTRKCKTRFPATDAGKTAGVAGQTWLKNLCIYMENLPELTASSPDTLVEEYAQKTWSDPTWLKKELAKNGKVLPRSYCGIPIEIKGKPWGVLLFDSAGPCMLGKNRITKGVYGKRAILAKVLEKV